MDSAVLVQTLGKILLDAGVIAILIGDLGIVFCGFRISFLRGLRNLLVPGMGFGDAMRRYPIFLWFFFGGVAAVAVGALLV